jgi:hypothetical protein
MRAVFAMMDLQPPAGSAPCATPAMLRHRFAAVEKQHTIHQRLERDEVGSSRSLHD